MAIYIGGKEVGCTSASSLQEEILNGVQNNDLKAIVRLTQIQFDSLKEKGSIVIDGTTYNYEPLTTIYITHGGVTFVTTPEFNEEKNRVNGEISRLETSLEESVNEVNADIEEINNEIEELKTNIGGVQDDIPPIATTISASSTNEETAGAKATHDFVLQKISEIDMSDYATKEYVEQLIQTYITSSLGGDY